MVKKQVVDSCQIEKKRVKNFLNTEVKSYAQYVLRNRTMPNIMDGLRVGGRKILWAALTGDLAKKKFVKMPALIGDALKVHYNHGDASLASTIVNFCCKHLNNYAPLEAIGQIPSLRVPKCDTATRYLMIRKSPFLEFFMYDKELLEIQEDEGEKIEPTFFLPIIPFTLLYRTGAPGFGFSFKSFSYNIDDIIDNTIQAVLNGSCIFSGIELKPEIVGIKPENLIFNSNKNKWYNVGEYELDWENNRLIVRDLPYNVSFEAFEELLQSLKDKVVITDWINLSEKDKLTYVIKFPVNRMKTLYENKWKFFQMFKLYSPIPNDILNCIDEDGKSILFFETPYELIDCFVKKRLKYYEKRKTRTIKVLKEQIQEYTYRIDFINKVIDGTIVVMKRKRNDILEDLKKFNIPSTVLDMKIWKLTKEEIEDLNDKIIKTKKELEYIEKTTIQEMYIFDLIEFKNKYSVIINK